MASFINMIIHIHVMTSTSRLSSSSIYGKIVCHKLTQCTFWPGWESINDCSIMGNGCTNQRPPPSESPTKSNGSSLPKPITTEQQWVAQPRRLLAPTSWILVGHKNESHFSSHTDLPGSLIHLLCSRNSCVAYEVITSVMTAQKATKVVQAYSSHSLTIHFLLCSCL